MGLSLCLPKMPCNVRNWKGLVRPDVPSWGLDPSLRMLEFLTPYCSYVRCVATRAWSPSYSSLQLCTFCIWGSSCISSRGNYERPLVVCVPRSVGRGQWHHNSCLHEQSQFCKISQHLYLLASENGVILGSLPYSGWLPLKGRKTPQRDGLGRSC